MAKFAIDPRTEETIDSPSLLDSFGREEALERAAARRQVALVEGSTPQLSFETRSLLRDRLRLLAIMLFLLFAVFLIRSLWFFEQYVLGPGAVVFYGHLAVTLVLAVVAQRLCSHCDVFEKHLRISELLIIGGPAAFFVLLNYNMFLTCCTLQAGHTHLPNITGGWLLLVFCYALFVPNSWQRAAVVLGLLGIAPSVVWLVARARIPQVAQLMQTEEFGNEFLSQFLVMALAVLTAVVGVKSIGSLRKEAFVARQLGQYRLRQMLGSGGMGEVYLAEHEMMKRPCAIKIIRPEKAGNPQVIARFEREVRATAKLSHWNSIDIYDYGRTDDGTFYYVMEFLPGHNLGELVNGHGPLPASRIVHLMQQACDALAEAHNLGLVHRDIKPANIFCAYRGGHFDVAKLLDFGLAKPIAEPQDIELTQEGAITGSPLFMSPEQAMGSAEVDERSDIYSLGAVMYFMATGHAPFEYPQPIKVMVAHSSEQPRPPRDWNPEVPVELEEIILRCLEKQPEDRFQDATALAEALRDVPISRPWTRTNASDWWQEYGCPQRKALAAAVMEKAAL
ncbi:MAG: serine/threonine protein kinase [Planctomycetales bacterium]|nr:serine/threonine protein kinase [Planctomycetales bacterium]